MFEFDQYSASQPGAAISPNEKISYANGIRKRSLLIWSEHCVECAAPECFQTCDLYKPRPDNRCRRFESGMRRNNNFDSQTGSAAEIVFGQWGKLEARGNTVLVRNSVVTLVENVVPRLQKLVNAFGRLVRRLGGSAPWTSLSFELLDYAGKRLQKASIKEEKPDGFLIEIYNPAGIICKVKFACAVAGSKMLSIPASGKLALPYWKQLALTAGYNRIFIPYAELSAVVESGLPYNLSFTPEQESGTQLVFISADFVSADDLGSVVPQAIKSEPINSKPLPTSGERPAAKCVVFDLDNTLWDGVLIEGEVTLKSSVPALFRSLDERGILISVASKNNEEEALAHLASLGLTEYLIHPAINWNQKSENIRLMAEKISIGTDTLVFIDDSPFEREEVLASVDGVEVLPETELEQLLEHPRLQGSGTVESANRRIMYQQQAQRSEAAVEFGEDYIEFLKSCDIVVTIGPVEEAQYPRVAELLQRTNQLNFSGIKYAREAIDELLQKPDTDKHVIHCSDKYGDYGLVGFSITNLVTTNVVKANLAKGNPESGNNGLKKIGVQDFMLSCRVQGKLIEKAFFSYLVNKYTDGAATLDVNFVSTKRNSLAKSVLQEIGFSMSPESAATLTVEPGQLDVDFLELKTKSDLAVENQPV